jgi:DNA replication and repair protein RecF
MNISQLSAFEPTTSATEILSVECLDLHNFRNYPKFNCQFQAKPIIITGANGIGKTNILEAISFLSPGRGLRNAKLDEIGHKNQDIYAPWSIKTVINSKYGLLEIVTNYITQAGDNVAKRQIKINNQPSKSHAELAKIFSVIWLTPQMDPIFISGSSNRRRFIDRLVYNFDAEHATRVTCYENVMRQRAKLLKKNLRDVLWLKSLEQTMAETAVAIAAARVQTVEYLQAMINMDSGPFPKAIITMQGELEQKVATVPSVLIEEQFRIRLEQLRETDFFTGRTNAGIHRSDLLVYHCAKNIEAAKCSTGEQKALLLSILLAEAKARIKWKSSVPVLLLDEVVAHLDAERREALFGEILAINAQCWITGTDKAVFSSLKNYAQFVEL